MLSKLRSPPEQSNMQLSVSVYFLEGGLFSLGEKNSPGLYFSREERRTVWFTVSSS